MARVDMMMEEGGEPHVIEINTVPGFSAQSIIPQQAEVAGMDKTALISRLIDDAFRTHRQASQSGQKKRGPLRRATLPLLNENK